MVRSKLWKCLPWVMLPGFGSDVPFAPSLVSSCGAVVTPSSGDLPRKRKREEGFVVGIAFGGT